MLTYIYIGNIDGIDVYEYYPEGDTSVPGRIGFDKNGKRVVIQKSEADPFGVYKGQAFYGAERYGKEGIVTVAWC